MGSDIGRSVEGRHWRAIAERSSELAETPPQDIDGGLRRLLDWLCDETHARDAFVVLAALQEMRPAMAARDPLRGWRPCRTLYHRESTERILLRTAYWAHAPRMLADPMAQALARTTGEHRAFLRHELVDDTTWARCPQVNELLRPLGIEDRLMCGIAIAPDVEVFVGVDRAAGDGRFGELDRDLMGAMAEGLAWFHRRVARSHGMSAAGEMFTPREREIVAQLLSPRSEKQIASALGLTERCTHQYIVGIYRKLGVSGRAELVARLLHGDWALDESVAQIASWVPSSRSGKISGVYASHEIRRSTSEGRAVRRAVQGK